MALSHEIVKHTGKGLVNLAESQKEHMTGNILINGTSSSAIQQAVQSSPVSSLAGCITAHPVGFLAGAAVLGGIALYAYLADE